MEGKIMPDVTLPYLALHASRPLNQYATGKCEPLTVNPIVNQKRDPVAKSFKTTSQLTVYAHQSTSSP
jgi:hypothetical protein